LQPAVGQYTRAHFNVYSFLVFMKKAPFGTFSPADDLHSQVL